MNCDNKFGECCNCPAKMSDGRLVTNYLSTSKIVSYIKEVNNISDEHEFRHFLQTNGASILEKEREFLKQNKTCDFSKR